MIHHPGRRASVVQAEGVPVRAVTCGRASWAHSGLTGGESNQATALAGFLSEQRPMNWHPGMDQEWITSAGVAAIVALDARRLITKRILSGGPGDRDASPDRFDGPPDKIWLN